MCDKFARVTSAALEVQRYGGANGDEGLPELLI